MKRMAGSRSPDNTEFNLLYLYSGNIRHKITGIYIFYGGVIHNARAQGQVVLSPIETIHLSIREDLNL